mmetsp:Transcript_615/g.754  ORF Transcript_615/g.754 Transcript_615/m.754 type:complete len:613 (-) Transcript_615:94-1932(-)
MAEKQIFQEFIDADEVNAVIDAAKKLIEVCALENISGLQRYHDLSSKLKPLVPYKVQRLFQLFDKQIDRRSKLLTSRAGQTLEGKALEDVSSVLISGAGPVGLRAAVELLLLGFDVNVVEKRTTFSRVNILMLWNQTVSDLVSLGAKFFYPKLKVHGDSHMGTREIQLCLLKTCILLGGNVHYGMELSNLRSVSGSKQSKPKWAGLCIKTQGSKFAYSSTKKDDVLSFKPDKRGDYEMTFKCNMIDTPEVDYDFFVPFDKAAEIDGKANLTKTSTWISSTLKRKSVVANNTSESKVAAFSFDALIIAEGEWSPSSKKIGVEKTIDRFNQAIGVVVNLDYDANDKDQAKLQSFHSSKLKGKWREGPLGELEKANIHVENIEYLKGTTHYIVITVEKRTLLEKGVVRDASCSPFLDKTNVDTKALYDLGRDISTNIGLPTSTKFCDQNSVQIFDFSTRARCIHSHLWLGCTTEKDTHAESHLDVDISNTPKLEAGSNFVQVPVFPVGDALLEPFWPQGLGSNRGFHGAIDAAFACLVLKEQGFEECSKERNLAYWAMNLYAFKSIVVQPEKNWNTDPLARYSAFVMDQARKTSKSEVPKRIADHKFTGSTSILR